MTKKQTAAAELIIHEIKSFVLQSPLNRMPTSEKDIIFR